MTEQINPESNNANFNHVVEPKTIEKLNEFLRLAKEDLEKTDKKIKLVDINGNEKIYTPVSVRNDIFRKYFGFLGRITTKIKELNNNDDNYSTIIEAYIDLLMDGKYVRIANAHANKNKYQAIQTQMGNIIETAETSAIGRVLANIGLAGGEFASLDDMIGIVKTKEDEVDESNIKIQDVQILEIKDLLKAKNLKLSEIRPDINDIKDLSYEDGMFLIDEIKKTRKKRNARVIHKQDSKEDNKLESKESFDDEGKVF